MNLRSINSVLIAVCLSAFSYGQMDTKLWSKLELEIPVTKKLSFGVQGQARFDRQVSRAYNLFAAPSIQYDLVKFIRLAGDYRLMRKPFNSETSNRIWAHRYTLDLEFRNLIDLLTEDSRLNLTFRLRGTAEFEKEKRTDNYVRYRLKLDYNLPNTKVKPFIAGEIFHHLNDEIVYTFTEVRSSHALDEYRIRFGANYPLKKQHKLTVFGMYQGDLHTSESAFVFGIGYAYRLKKLLD